MVWTLDAEMEYPSNLMKPMMDYWMGKSYEEGLQNLKNFQKNLNLKFKSRNPEFPFFIFLGISKENLSSLNILMKMLVKDYDKTELRNFRNFISGKIKTLEFYLNFTLEANEKPKNI